MRSSRGVCHLHVRYHFATITSAARADRSASPFYIGLSTGSYIGSSICYRAHLLITPYSRARRSFVAISGRSSCQNGQTCLWTAWRGTLFFVSCILWRAKSRTREGTEKSTDEFKTPSMRILTARLTGWRWIQTYWERSRSSWASLVLDLLSCDASLRLACECARTVLVSLRPANERSD